MHFLPYLLVLTVGVVCIISNKYQLPNKLVKYQCFYTNTLHLSFISKNNWCSLFQRFLETFSFYFIFTSFDTG